MSNITDIFILDSPEISCQMVMKYVFTEFCGVFLRRSMNVKIIKNISEIHNNSIVFMSDSITTNDPVQLLYQQAPDAIYIAWYWLNTNVSKLKNFIYVYEDYKNVDRDPRIQYFRKLHNSVPLLLRANEGINDIGTYTRNVIRDYCFMGCAYCSDWVQNIPFTGIYKSGNWNDYVAYPDRRNIYLSSTFALGFQGDLGILNKHVSQRIFEGMAYGCVVLTNSPAAVEQTNGIAVLINNKQDMIDKMKFYLNNPEEIKSKQEQGYIFVKNSGTNEYAYDMIKQKAEAIGIDMNINDNGATNIILRNKQFLKQVHKIDIDETTVGKLLHYHTILKVKYGSFAEELPEQIMALLYLHGNERILEIGGNIGRNSLIMSSILSNSENLTVMESDKNIAIQLRENRDLNGFKFKIIDKALSNRQLIQKGWDCIESNELLPGYTQVDTISYDDFKLQHNTDFDTLVIDCEGSFYYILLDMVDILQNITTIIIENDFHDHNHKIYVDSVLHEHNFKNVFSLPLPNPNNCSKFKNTRHEFYQVWKKEQVE